MILIFDRFLGISHFNKQGGEAGPFQDEMCNYMPEQHRQLLRDFCTKLVSNIEVVSFIATCATSALLDVLEATWTPFISFAGGNRKRAGLCGTMWKGKRRYMQVGRHQKPSRQLSTLASTRSGSLGMSLLSVSCA